MWTQDCAQYERVVVQPGLWQGAETLDVGKQGRRICHRQVEARHYRIESIAAGIDAHRDCADHQRFAVRGPRPAGCYIGCGQHRPRNVWWPAPSLGSTKPVSSMTRPTGDRCRRQLDIACADCCIRRRFIGPPGQEQGAPPDLLVGEIARCRTGLTEQHACGEEYGAQGMKWAAPHYGLLHVRQAESRPILLVIRQKCQARTRSAPARTLLHPAAARSSRRLPHALAVDAARGGTVA